jgi:hypothetical protein
LIYGRYTPDKENAAADRALAILRALVERVARAGRLTRDIETATQMIHATGRGTTFTLLSIPPEERDVTLSTQCREAILAAVTTAAPDDIQNDVVRHVVALQALLEVDRPGSLSPAEASLLTQCLARLIQKAGSPAAPPS